MKLFLNVISKLIDYIKIMESKLSIKTNDVHEKVLNYV
jgi:hypothetical protein